MLKLIRNPYNWMLVISLSLAAAAMWQDPAQFIGIMVGFSLAEAVKAWR